MFGVLCCAVMIKYANTDTAAVYTSPAEDFSHCNSQPLGYIMLHAWGYKCKKREPGGSIGEKKSTHCS